MRAGDDDAVLTIHLRVRKMILLGVSILVQVLRAFLVMRNVRRYSAWYDAVFPSYVLLCRMQVHAGAGGASGSRGTIENQTGD